MSNNYRGWEHYPQGGAGSPRTSPVLGNSFDDPFLASISQPMGRPYEGTYGSQSPHTPSSHGVPPHGSPLLEPSPLNNRWGPRGTYYPSESSERASMDSSGVGDSASSPIKKRKERSGSSRGKAIDLDGEGKKGTPNNRWKSAHTEALFHILVEEELKGNKAQKRFKSCAINRAVADVNAMFNTHYTAENVNNHLKTWKAKWVLYDKAKSMSGVGWDEATKMVVLEGHPYRELVAAKSKLVPFLNVPLPYHDLLKVVCGEDHATGKDARSVYEPFGEPLEGSLPITDDGVEVDVNDADGVGVGSTSASQKSARPTNVESNAGSSRRRKSKKDRGKDDEFDSDMRTMMNTIGEGFALFRVKDLGDAINSVPGFADETMMAAYAKLYEDKKEALFFIGMPPCFKVSWMQKFEMEMRGGGGGMQ